MPFQMQSIGREGSAKGSDPLTALMVPDIYDAVPWRKVQEIR